MIASSFISIKATKRDQGISYPMHLDRRLHRELTFIALQICDDLLTDTMSLLK